MHDDELRDLWTEDDLDRALAVLQARVGTDDDALAAGRTKLLAAASATAEIPPAAGRPDERVLVAAGSGSARGRPVGGGTGRRARWRWVAAAAAVATLVAGGVVAQTVSIGGRSPAGTTAMAVDLGSVADRVGSAYLPLRPGQFRYVDFHAWWGASVPMRPKLKYLAENRLETWIPAKETDTWLVRRDVTGRRKWIQGSEAEARKVKYPPGSKIQDPLMAGWPEGEWRTPCGDVYGFGSVDTSRGRCRGGFWSMPTQTWVARLPRDPHKLYAQLRKDSIKNNGRGNVELLNTAADGLRTGQLPVDLQAALFRALALIPDLTISKGLANADGRVGVGYGIDDGRTRFDLILDPKTGEFIGEREVVTRNGDIEGPKGTVLGYTAFSTAVVDRLGQRS